MKTLSVRTAAPRLLLLLALLVFPLLLPPLAPALNAQGSQEGAWELVETLVNPTNAKLEFHGGGGNTEYFGEERFEGKFRIYTVSASSLQIADRDVDHGYEYHNVTVSAALQQPPAVMVPGETVTLTAQLSHAGTTEGDTFSVLFWYSGKGIKMQPAGAFGYAPWNPNFDGVSAAVYSFTVPPAREGGEIEIYASFWNAEPCNVMWRYRARPGAAQAEETPTQPEPEPEPTAEDKPRKPVIILPGIYGSYLASSWEIYTWLENRGVAPELLAVDPLAHYYDDLAATLQNAGYVLGKDLFMGAYDWRMPPGPSDGAYDGVVSGLSGASITDDRYQYGVDYLGYWLKQAAERWRADHDGKVLDSVDIIAHSTGGLVARVYLQSAAYGAHYRSADGKAVRLPKVNQFIMVAVPNRGASLPWQAMHNNFFREDPASKYVMTRIITASYNKLLKGLTIKGPDYDITLNDVTDPDTGEVDTRRFISLYCPTFRSLLATYPFILRPDNSLVSANDLPELRNDLVLDLNNGLDLPGQSGFDDSNRFADAAKRTTVYYGDGLDTAYMMREMHSAASDVLFPLDAYFDQDAVEGTLWYQDIVVPEGDTTVPALSAADQFEGDSRIDVVEVTEGDRTHTGLLANPAVQTGILSVLGVDARDVRLSSGLAVADTMAALSAVYDPVGSLITDGKGRRLGWTPATGPLAEIPGSAWYGEGDGFAVILGEVVQPLSVALEGLGGDYLVQITGQQDGHRVGLLAEGQLAEGSTQNLTLETRAALPPAEVESDGDAQLQQAASRLVKIVIIAVVTVVVLSALAVLVLVLVLRKRRRG